MKVCIFNRRSKKDEALAQELEIEEKEKTDRVRALIARRNIYRKRKNKSVEITTQQKEKKVNDIYIYIIYIMCSRKCLLYKFQYVQIL